MVFQPPMLLEWRPTLQNGMRTLKIVPNTLSQAEKGDRARAPEPVGLNGFEGTRPSELSGGTRQRPPPWRALVHEPEVLILDDRFGALDAFPREDLWQTMHWVTENEPFSGVLSSQDLRGAIILADRVVVLSGRPARTR